MSQYEAPVKDMMFVLDQLIGLDDLSKLKDCEGTIMSLLNQY